MELAKSLRGRLDEGHVALGTFVAELTTPAVPMMLRQNDFDFMLVDTEHGCFNPGDVMQLILAGKQEGLCPLVRVPGPDQAEIKRVLDAGAEGIMVPMSQSLEDVQRAVSSSKYPPLGQRGAHFARPHTRFTGPDDTGTFMEEANRNLFTIIQIETRPAVDLIDEIAATEGVDVLYVGPGDLSVALGHPGRTGHPEVLEIVERVGQACREYGKIAGGHFLSADILPELMGRGVRFLGFGSIERMLQVGVVQTGDSARQVIKATQG